MFCEFMMGVVLEDKEASRLEPAALQYLVGNVVKTCQAVWRTGEDVVEKLIGCLYIRQVVHVANFNG